MANHISHASLPYPIKGTRYTVQVPFLDADGDPTDPTTPDTEVSQDGGAFADAAEEVTTISGSNGLGYITLTGAETNNSSVGVAFKVASGPKATLMMLNPRVLASVGTGTLSAGSAGGGTLGTLLAYDVTGCFIKTTGGTGGGGTGGANNQVRKVVTYNTGTGAFTVAPNWETTPSTDTTYDVLLPEGVTLGMLKALNPATPGRTVVVDSSGLVAVPDTQKVDLNTLKTQTVTAAAGVTFPSSIASPTNITAGTITTVTNVTNAPTSGDLTATMKTSVTAAATAATPTVTAGTVTDKTGYALSTAGVQAIWDTLTSALTTVGSIGKKLADWAVGTLTSGERTAIANEVEAQIIDDTDSEKVLTAITDKIASVNPDLGGLTTNAIASAVWSNGTRVLTAGTNIVLAKGTGVTGFNDLSAAQVNAEVDTAIADAALATAAGIPSAAVIADAVWDEARSGHATAGTFGEGVSSVQGNVTGSVASVTAEVSANVTKISNSATAADNLEAGALGLVPGTCATGSTTTAIVTNLTEATDDHYNGRVITFTSGALAGQSTSISDYNGTSKTLTVVQLTEAPADTDSFVIS